MTRREGSGVRVRAAKRFLWRAAADFSDLLAVAAKDDRFPILLDRLDQGGEATLGVVHVGSDHSGLGC